MGVLGQRLKRESVYIYTHTHTLGSVPKLGRSPGERNVNPLQYSCLANSLDRGTWWAAVLVCVCVCMYVYMTDSHCCVA